MLGSSYFCPSFKWVVWRGNVQSHASADSRAMLSSVENEYLEWKIVETGWSHLQKSLYLGCQGIKWPAEAGWLLGWNVAEGLKHWTSRLKASSLETPCRKLRLTYFIRILLSSVFWPSTIIDFSIFMVKNNKIWNLHNFVNVKSGTHSTKLPIKVWKSTINICFKQWVGWRLSNFHLKNGTAF